ncbi:MAG: C39 family peptidase [Chthoniobacterales bacterium]
MQLGRKTVHPPEEETPSPTARRSWIWLVLVAVLVLGIVLAGAGYYYCGRREIPPAGGLYFFSTLELNVPRFAQADPRWGSEALGSTSSSMAEEGCAVSSAAMVLAFYGQDIDPGRLNAFLTTHEGYTPQGWLYWERAAEFDPGRAKHVYEDQPSYFLIDSNLLRGNPVIVRVRLPNGMTHFVVIVGKRGFNYLIQDPGGGGENGIYPLRQLVSKIEALRFYQRMEN